MPQIVHTLAKEIITQMREHYRAYMRETPQGAVFQAKTTDAVITAYRSGKVLFQGRSPDREAAKWVQEKANPSVKKTTDEKKHTHSYTPPATLFTTSHLGSDEAGTGDYFGPITVACVFVKQDQIAKLKQTGVRDSKNLTDQAIQDIAKDMLQFDISYSLLVLHNEKYNHLKQKGWSQGKMKAILHHQAIQNVLKQIGSTPYDGILIDQFCEPAVYHKHIASEQEAKLDKMYFLTKAESYSIAVAAASIIARAKFLQEMDRLSRKMGMTLPKGASRKVDETIAAIINKEGRSALNRCAKTHFANTKKAEHYLD